MKLLRECNEEEVIDIADPGGEDGEDSTLVSIHPNDKGTIVIHQATGDVYLEEHHLSKIIEWVTKGRIIFK